MEKKRIKMFVSIGVLWCGVTLGVAQFVWAGQPGDSELGAVADRSTTREALPSDEEILERLDSVAVDAPQAVRAVLDDLRFTLDSSSKKQRRRAGSTTRSAQVQIACGVLDPSFSPVTEVPLAQPGDPSHMFVYVSGGAAASQVTFVALPLFDGSPLPFIFRSVMLIPEDASSLFVPFRIPASTEPDTCGMWVLIVANNQGLSSFCVFEVVCPVSACCLPDGTCLSNSVDADCLAQGGIFHPDIDCASGICDAPECAPATCQNFVACQGRSDCFCFSLFGGGGACALSTSCGPLTRCPNGVCPAGTVCIVDSCCGENVCMPLNIICPDLPPPPPPPASSQPPVPPSGTLTTAGEQG